MAHERLGTAERCRTTSQLHRVEHPPHRLLSAGEVERQHRAELVHLALGEIVLGSPLAALGHLVALLSTQPEAAPLAAGEIISTGTLTDAHPVAPGEAWSTEIRGLPLSGMRLTFA